ncbi:hypothetical protein B0H16DRAFT_1778675 [Mycena metata]|uniref:Uncharacterized protein n=1 Tax=Mycena metata TaxID=1033252 RepID=A0AAD7HSU3_9AGAR|nr:hypothetical protein B0H16DRAFT_1778675 [Mycena metata]
MNVNRCAAFFLTAHFSEEDHPYGWLTLWLSRRCVRVPPLHLFPICTPPCLSAFPFRFANTRAVLPYHPPARRFARRFPYIFTTSPYTFPHHPALPRRNSPPPSQFSAPSFSRALPAPAASHWPHSPRVPPCTHPFLPPYTRPSPFLCVPSSTSPSPAHTRAILPLSFPPTSSLRPL